MGTDNGFTNEIYAMIREGAQRSAGVVVPLVLECLSPKLVLDVGCGEGWWGKAFEEAGCNVAGLDGPEATPVIRHLVRDLAHPGSLTASRWDLAVCLEVAEHLAPQHADSLIKRLCTAAPVVLFSAAIPGQGGVGHLNEQWPGYWVEKFDANGYACSGALRWQIWDDDRVENWYRQNLIVAAAAPATLPFWFDTPLAPVWPVVHPVLYDARRP